MIITGRTWKYGDSINTDGIFPGKYTYSTMSPEEMAKHAMENLDPQFVSKVRAGDILIAGSNFGCGSSREQAVICLKASGIRAIVGKSFARIYYRNSINNGLLAIQCPEAVDVVNEGEEITINTEKCTVAYSKGIFSFPPLAPSVLEIMETGGLIPFTIKRLKARP